MTLDENGSASAGNPASSQPDAGNGSPVTGSDWTSGLSEGNRKLVEAKGWKGLDDAFTSYSNLEAKIGEGVKLPGKDAKPEDWQKTFDAMKPEKADGYDFALPQGIPDNFPYDKEFAAEVKSWMHEAGLHPVQAQKVHDQYVTKLAGMAQATQAAEDKAVGDAHAAIVKAWGAPETETYKQNLSYVDRLIGTKPGLMDALKAAGLMATDGAVKNALITQTLADWGKALLAEDVLHKGDNKPSMVNPFHRDTENLTAQGQLLDNDSQRAKELIIQAGRDPKSWRL